MSRLRTHYANPRIRRGLNLAFLLLVVTAAVFALRDDWDEIGAALSQVTLSLGLAATGASLVGLVCSLQAWRALLAGMGTPTPSTGASHIFFISQLGKYLPGSVWVPIVQVQLGRRHGIDPATSAASFLLNLMVSIVTGSVIGALCLVVVGTNVQLGLLVVVAVVGPILLALAVLVMPAVLRRLPPSSRRWLPQQWPPLPSLALATVWTSAAWFAYGLQLHLLASAVGISGDWLTLRALGAMTVSFVAGIVFIIAPAGAGVREASIVAILAPSSSTALAASAAILSRLFLTAADLLAAGSALATTRLGRTRT